jgi:hypothetical protein
MKSPCRLMPQGDFMGILWLVLLEGKVKNERSEYWLQSKELAVQICINLSLD